MTYSLKNILWATDFSGEADQALAYAGLLARAFQARLTAVHVIPEASSVVFDLISEYFTEAGGRTDRLKSAAEAKIRALGVKRGLDFHEIIFGSGSPAKAIVAAAAGKKADLIVMGKTGRTGLDKILIGSTANQVLRNSPVPVLVIKKRPVRPSLRTIIVPTDFSERENVEQDVAWALAGRLKASLVLLHVLELQGFDLLPDDIAKMLKAVEDRLRAKTAARSRAVEVKEEVVRAVNAAVGITDYAALKKAGLIVMSTAIHSRLGRFFLGSNTEKVLSYTDVPVFAIPASYGAE